MRMVVEEAPISYKGREEPPKCVLIHQAGTGAKPIDDHVYGWQWLMSHNSHLVHGFVSSIMKELLVQIFVIQASWMRLRPMKASGL